MTAQHSPLPWRVSAIAPYSVYSGMRRVADAREANCVCYTESDQVNARFIERACNNVERLASALKLMRLAFEQAVPASEMQDWWRDAWNQTRETLAQWEGEQ